MTAPEIFDDVIAEYLCSTRIATTVLKLVLKLVQIEKVHIAVLWAEGS